MSEEKIIQYLKEFNFWGEENLYFYTFASQNCSNQPNLYGIYGVSFKYFIINKTERGVYVIPFDVTGKSVKEGSLFLPNENIKEVYIEKYKFMFFLSGTQLVIRTTDENKVLELEYIGKEDSNKISALNMYKFYLSYQN